jgi:hypothetical protein
LSGGRKVRLLAGAELCGGAFHGGHRSIELALLFFYFLFDVFDFLLDLLGVEAFYLQIHANVGEDRHVLIGDPDEGEEADEVPAPVLEEKLVSRDDEEEGRDVMAEAVFAGEQVKEFPFEKRGRFLAASLAVFPRFAEDFFVGNRPGNTSDRYRQNEEPDDLYRKRHSGSMRNRSCGLAALLH